MIIYDTAQLEVSRQQETWTFFCSGNTPLSVSPANGGRKPVHLNSSTLAFLSAATLLFFSKSRQRPAGLLNRRNKTSCAHLSNTICVTQTILLLHYIAPPGPASRVLPPPLIEDGPDRAGNATHYWAINWLWFQNTPDKEHKYSFPILFFRRGGVAPTIQSPIISWPWTRI